MSEKYKFTLKKALLHLKTIIIHKHYVFIYCCKCGIPFQGIIHDLSKFSPKEFITNAKYTIKGKSPIDVQKKLIGYSFPWLHHKGRNPHHYEFWMDKFDDGCYVHRMPYKYMIECLCDYLAANKAYNGKNANYTKEFDWWIAQRDIKNMHPDSKRFLDITLTALYAAEHHLLIDKKFYFEDNKCYIFNDIDSDEIYDEILNKKFLKATYDNILSTSKFKTPIKILQPED